MSDLFGNDDESEALPAAPLLPMATPKDAARVRAVQTAQDAFYAISDRLQILYKGFDKTRRPDVKAQLKEMYEALKDLGVAVGVSRFTMGPLWDG